jgi:hypothetical protein
MKLLLFSLLTFVVGVSQAQTEKSGVDINTILTIYEKHAVVYFEESTKQIKHSTNNAETIKSVNMARRMAHGATIESINKDAKDRFYNQKVELSSLISYLDGRYRSDLKLPNEFFENVSNELKKEMK